MNDGIRRQMLDAVVGDPDPERDRRLGEELAADPELRREYDRLREVWEALGDLPEGSPPEGARAVARAAALVDGLRVDRAKRLPARTGWAFRIAASLVLFATGGAAGVAWARANPAPGTAPALPTADAPAPNAERPLFAFIIRGEPDAEGPDLEVAMSGFARELWSDERLIWAERLSMERSAWVSAEGESAPEAVQAAARLFMVRAADREEAIRLARQAPHLAEGGVVEILGSSPTPGG
jgi:hypothetical protein